MFSRSGPSDLDMEHTNIDFSSSSKGRMVPVTERNAASTSSTTTPPQMLQQDSSSWNSPTVSSNVDLFNFSSTATGSSLPPFEPTSNHTLNHMTFPPLSSPYINPSNSQTRLSQASKDSRDSKRIKVESPAVGIDSVNAWLHFDEDTDKLGSFEIDYSRLCGPADQSRPDASLTPGLGSGLYSKQRVPAKEDDLFDDNALDHSLSEDEEILEAMNLNESINKSRPMGPPTMPAAPGPAPNFYSATMGWQRPQMDLGSMAMPNDRFMFSRNLGYTLQPEERRLLLEVALGPNRMSNYFPINRFDMGFAQHSMQQGNAPLFQAGGDMKSSMVAGRSLAEEASSSGTSQNTHDLKHKAPSKAESSSRPTPPQRSDSQGESSAKEKQRSAERIAHNDVERKYRTNLKDKITELRNAVPSLQQMADVDDPMSQGAKVSKGMVLTKATEYIHQLEQQNKEILREHAQLLRRIQAFETLLASSRGPEIMPSHSMTLFDPRGFC